MQADRVSTLLKTFGSMPKDVLIKHISMQYDITEAKADSVIISLAHQRKLFHDSKDNWCYRYQGMKKNFTAPFALDVITMLGGTDPLRLAKAEYPFDYIFEADHKLYQIIDCFNEGIYKLNFKRNMLEQRPADGYACIPILLMRNMPIGQIGKELYPKGEFYFATAEFDITDLTSIKTVITCGSREE